MNLAKMIEFRSVYLRAITQAWADPTFSTALTVPGGTIPALEKQFPPWRWPWPHTCELQIEATDTFVWVDDYWLWDTNLVEGVLLSLPLTPTHITGRPVTADEQARALADYYRQRSSLFGDDWHADRSQFTPAPPFPTTNRLSDVGVSGLDSAAPAGGFVPPGTLFEALEIVLTSAMAKAWTDHDFATLLTTDPAKAMHTIRSYVLPWNTKIFIRNDTAARWQPVTSPQSPWTSLTRHLLKLHLPSKPRKANFEPIALAAYNATGAEYPFSCCG